MLIELHGFSRVESIITHIKLSFETPFIKVTILSLVLLLLAVPFIYEAVRYFGKASSTLMKELYLRYFTWLVLALVLILPLLAGRIPTIIAVSALAILCFFEYAKATKLSSQKALVWIVFISILLSFFTVADNFFAGFLLLSLCSLVLLLIVGINYLKNKRSLSSPHFAIFALALFATSLGHFAYLANFKEYASLMLLLLICIEFNDVFAYICGKLFGKKQLCPKISPKKTVAGFIGALFMTTSLFYFLGSLVFTDSPLSGSIHLIIMGFLTSLLGQCGDLLFSGIKRHFAIKDFSQSLPGHGGFLDRFDSLILVSPIMFHYMYFFDSNILNQTFRVFST